MVSDMNNKEIALYAYSVAMGWLESSVVIYLRNTNGADLLRIEQIRELATLIMIFTVAVLASTTLKQMMIAFLRIFALWDLTYYLGLYICIGWPMSLFTIDCLFLIPVPWIAPVWLPISISAGTLLVTSGVTVRREAQVHP